MESGDAIRDDLDEVITLNSVSVIVAEYIPFGTNLLVELNYSMGSVERVQGGFFTAAVEDSGEGTDGLHDGKGAFTTPQNNPSLNPLTGYSVILFTTPHTSNPWRSDSSAYHSLPPPLLVGC